MLPTAEIEIQITDDQAKILSPEALDFITTLHHEFNPTRLTLLKKRQECQQRLDAGELPTFLPNTQYIREGEWQVASTPSDLQDRRVEITGPVDRKMLINALNSGARVFMADLRIHWLHIGRMSLMVK